MPNKVEVRHERGGRCTRRCVECPREMDGARYAESKTDTNLIVHGVEAKLLSITVLPQEDQITHSNDDVQGGALTNTEEAAHVKFAAEENKTMAGYQRVQCQQIVRVVSKVFVIPK